MVPFAQRMLCNGGGGGGSGGNSSSPHPCGDVRGGLRKDRFDE